MQGQTEFRPGSLKCLLYVIKYFSSEYELCTTSTGLQSKVKLHTSANKMTLDGHTDGRVL